MNAIDHRGGLGDLEPLDLTLRALPPAVVDDARAGGVRRRCHAALAARRTAALRAERRPRYWSRAVWPLVVGAVAAMYFAALVGRLLS